MQIRRTFDGRQQVKSYQQGNNYQPDKIHERIENSEGKQRGNSISIVNEDKMANHKHDISLIPASPLRLVAPPRHLASPRLTLLTNS